GHAEIYEPDLLVAEQIGASGKKHVRGFAAVRASPAGSPGRDDAEGTVGQVEHVGVTQTADDIAGGAAVRWSVRGAGEEDAVVVVQRLPGVLLLARQVHAQSDIGVIGFGGAGGHPVVGKQVGAVVCRQYTSGEGAGRPGLGPGVGDGGGDVGADGVLGVRGDLPIGADFAVAHLH